MSREELLVMVRNRRESEPGAAEVKKELARGVKREVKPDRNDSHGDVEFVSRKRVKSLPTQAHKVIELN